MMGPMKQARPMAAKSRPSVVELSPRDCMLRRLLNRTCRMSDAPHTTAPLAFISAKAAASLSKAKQVCQKKLEQRQDQSQAR